MSLTGWPHSTIDDKFRAAGLQAGKKELSGKE